MGRHWRVSCPYCNCELASGIGYGDKIPDFFVPFLRCTYCGRLIKTGSQEYLTTDVNVRTHKLNTPSRRKEIEQSLDRTNNKEYRDMLNDYGYKIHPICEADREKYKNLDFNKYINKNASQEATESLYNSTILIRDDIKDPETGGIKEELLADRRTGYNRSLVATKWSIFIGFVVGILSGIIFSAIDPNSVFLVILAFGLGIGGGCLTFRLFELYYSKKDEKENPENGDDKNLNTKIGNNISSLIKKIKIFQISFWVLLISLISFLIIFPISIQSKHDEKVNISSSTTLLTNLNPNETVYCELSGNYYNIYIKENGILKKYSFRNLSMYTSSNNVRKGYATGAQIKNYFESNIYSGKPDIQFLFPYYVPVLCSVSIGLFILLCIILFVIHKFSKELIFKSRKTDKELQKINKLFKDDEISESEYKSYSKNYLSENIICNKFLNKIFKIFY